MSKNTTANHEYVVILAGGSGTRLYPLTKARKRLKKVFTLDMNVMAELLNCYNETFGGNKIISAYNLRDYCKAKFVKIVNTILNIESSAIINLFRKMTNEQLGKILRAYLNNNPKDLIEDENKIYTELTKHRDSLKKSNSDKILKGWETRKANQAKNNKEKSQLQVQVQRDKEEMIKLRAENETLKKSKQQYNGNWNNNWNKNKKQAPEEDEESRKAEEAKMDRAEFW